MFDLKRLYTALFMGFLCGIACFITGKYLLNLPLAVSNFGFILINRMMIGFVVGISCLRDMHWAKHGALIGSIVGVIFAYTDAMLGFSWWVILGILVVNPVFGLIIEFGTTKLFKRPIKQCVAFST